MDSQEQRRIEQDWTDRFEPLVDMAWDQYTKSIEWPAVEVAQRSMDRQGVDIDVQEALQQLPKLPGELRPVLWTHVTIPLRLLRHAASASNVLPIAFQIVQHAVAAYLSDEEEPSISSDDLALKRILPGRGSNVWYLVGRLLSEDRPNLFAGGSFVDDKWTFAVNGPIARQMRDLRTIDDYFDRQREILLAAQGHRSEVVQLDPADQNPLAPVRGQARVFVLMPFGEPWSDGAFEMFKRAAADVSVEPRVFVYRADEIEESGRITDQVTHAIRYADVVLADISGLNANVMWELGFAFALQKPIVIANQDVSKSPFDVAEWRQVSYSTAFSEDETSSLTRFLESLLGVTQTASDLHRLRDELSDLMGNGAHSGDSVHPVRVFGHCVGGRVAADARETFPEVTSFGDDRCGQESGVGTRAVGGV